MRAKPDGLTLVALRAKRPLIAPSRPSSSRLSHLKKSLWRRKVGRGRAPDRAPGVSAPPFLQDLRLCGLHFPRTGLGQRAPRRCPLKGLSRTLKGFSKAPPDPWGKGAGWPLHLLYNKVGAKGALMRPGERCQFPRRHKRNARAWALHRSARCASLPIPIPCVSVSLLKDTSPALNSSKHGVRSPPCPSRPFGPDVRL